VNGTQQNQRGFKALAGKIYGQSAVTSTGGGITVQSLGGIASPALPNFGPLLDSMGTVVKS